jgi:hypothetical protein
MDGVPWYAWVAIPAIFVLAAAALALAINGVLRAMGWLSRRIRQEGPRRPADPRPD